jgi:hypothetical protein
MASILGHKNCFIWCNGNNNWWSLRCRWNCSICRFSSYRNSKYCRGSVNRYRSSNEFSLAGHGSVSLLTGTGKNHTDYASIAPELSDLGVTPPNKQSTSVCSSTQVVPAFAEKLALFYEYSECGEAALKLEVGYQAHIYINALQSIDMGSGVILPPVAPNTVGVFARTFKRNPSDFALSGPYVALDVKF